MTVIKVRIFVILGGLGLMEVILGSYQILAMLWFVSCRVAHGFYFFNELIVIMHQIHNWEEEKIR